MAWLSGWSWAKEISLTGQSGAGTLYQVDLDIGDSAGGDFHLEGHCTNFPQDIEVTDNDGTTLLDFSIEDITADPIKLWVEVADDLGSNQKVWVYYGKSGASTNSDIDATFLFGDDFPGSSIDLAKWDDVTSKASVSGGIMSYGGVADWGKLRSITQFGPDTACRSKIKFLSPTSYIDAFGFMNPANTHNAYLTVQYTPANKIQSKDGTTETDVDTNIPLNSWFIADINVLGGTNTRCFYDDIEGTNSPKTSNPSNASDIEVHFMGRSTGTCVQSEWVIVRKYQAIEPAFSSAGSEQSAPVAGHPTMKRWGGIPGMQYTGHRSW